MLWNQDAFEHCAFERRTVRDPGTARVCGGRRYFLRDRLSRNPSLDRAVAAGVADAQHFGRRMLGVGAGTDAMFSASQHCSAAALDIPVERHAVFGAALA